MTRKKSIKGNEPTTVVANDPDDRKGALKNIGGSQSDQWNKLLANQAMQALWMKHSDTETRDRQMSATVAALVGIRPRDGRHDGGAADRRPGHLCPVDDRLPCQGTPLGRAETRVAGDGRIAGLEGVVLHRPEPNS
jgi:hypothetical protein